jgi:hypothetical protein
MRDREAPEEADLGFVVQKCCCVRKLKKYFGRSSLTTMDVVA